MDKEWFTVAEMEEETKIPHQTIRRYIKLHGHHLILKKKHKSYFINFKSVEVIFKIRNLYSHGKTAEQVDEELANSSIPMTIEYTDDHEQVSLNVPETLLELRNDMKKLNEKLSDQEKFNELLIEKLVEQNEFIKQQQKYIDEKLSKRDETLMRSLRELQQTKNLIAATQEKKKGWKFWNRK